MMLSLLLLLITSISADTVRFAAVIFRHGARTPLRKYPPLEYRVKWKFKDQYLTPLGQRQEFLLGAGLRLKYVETEKLISQNYNSSEIYIRSTNIQHSILSAQSLVLGLYPDKLEKLTETQLKKENIWKPAWKLTIDSYIEENLKNSSLPYDIPIVPISSYIWTNDHLLQLESCPAYNHYRKEFYKSKKFAKLYDEFKNSINDICVKLKLDCKALKSENLFYFIDHLLCAAFDGQLPELDNTDILETLFANLLKNELLMKDYIQSIVMNELSKILIDNMNMIINDYNNSYKMALFSADSHILMGHLLGMLKINNTKIDSEFIPKIPFASHLIIELHSKKDTKNPENYYVNVKYNSIKIIKEMKYTEFQSSILSLGKLNDEWDKICQISN